jgi:hypothetical protein
MLDIRSKVLVFQYGYGDGQWTKELRFRTLPAGWKAHSK